MDNISLLLESNPTSSLLRFKREERLPYITKLVGAPENIQKFLTNPSTGAYIRGLAKTYNLSTDQTSRVAFIVLKIGIGEEPLAKLGPLLSSELQIPNDKAQQIAQEIERDLLEPVRDDIMNIARQQRQTQTGIASHGAEQIKRQLGNPQNILDLKNQPQPPQPPPIINKPYKNSKDYQTDQ